MKPIELVIGSRGTPQAIVTVNGDNVHVTDLQPSDVRAYINNLQSQNYTGEEIVQRLLRSWNGLLSWCLFRDQAEQRVGKIAS